MKTKRVSAIFVLVLVLGLVSNASGQIASNPSPADGAIHSDTWVSLSWSPAANAALHDVYFGTDPTLGPATFRGRQVGTSYDPGPLEVCTTYYWRIDEVGADGTTIYKGAVWSFTVIGVPPIADAGPDQTVTDSGCDGSEPVVLDGSGSADPDGYIVSYQWLASPTGNPEDAILIAEGPTATVTLPLGTYTVMLIVTDGGGCTDTDTVEITVSPSPDTLYGTVTTTDPTGDVHALRHVMVTLDWGGTQHTVYTDDNGDYVIDMSNDNTFCVGSAVNGFLRVTLEDEGDGTDPYIKVYDNNVANPIFAETVSFRINTVNDLEQNVDLSFNANIDATTLPIAIGDLDDAAIIYFHTYQAVDLALKILGMGFDHVLPVEVIAWATGGTRWSPPSTIFIAAADSDFWSGNRPDNREWHEFSHHIMDDSLIAGDNAMPIRHPGDTNHGGYPNHCTSDSWAEGFAEYDSCVIAEATGDSTHPNPACYGVGGNNCAFDLEANWLAWILEEIAVASLLWDLHDGIDGNDNDWVSLSVGAIWNQINAVGHQNIRDLYLTLDALNLPDLTGDGDNDGIDNLDELFIAHGHFSDADGDQTYDANEAIGFTGDAARPNREAMPEIPGSYIVVNVIDSSTLEPVDVSEFDVEMRVEPPHDYLNVDFTIRKKDDGSLYFTMPPPSYSAKAYIYAKKNGYYHSTPSVIDSSFYWEKIKERGLEYLTKHTFYLTPADVEVSFVTLASPSPSDTTETLPPSISSVSEGQDYYIEIWASDVGSTNTGLTLVYVDMRFDPCDGATVQEIDHGGIFTEFKSGTIEPCGIDELGGSCLAGAGIEPEWARVAVVKVRAEAREPVCCSLAPSDAGIAVLGRGLIPWSKIVFSGDTCCFPSTYPTYSDWLTLGKPNCWCGAYQCDGDADGITSGFPFNYRIFSGDLALVVNNWKKQADDPTLNPCADIDHKDSGFPFFYRVFRGDLAKLIDNWQKKDAQLPGDCPRDE